MRNDRFAERHSLNRQPLTSLDIWIGWLHLDNTRDRRHERAPEDVIDPQVRLCPQCWGGWCRACNWTGLTTRPVGSR